MGFKVTTSVPSLSWESFQTTSLFFHPAYSLLVNFLVLNSLCFGFILWFVSSTHVSAGWPSGLDSLFWLSTATPIQAIAFGLCPSVSHTAPVGKKQSICRIHWMCPTPHQDHKGRGGLPASRWQNKDFAAPHFKKPRQNKQPKKCKQMYFFY